MTFKVYIKGHNSKFITPDEIETLEFLDKEYAQEYVKEFNHKHLNTDLDYYLEACFYN